MKRPLSNLFRETGSLSQRIVRSGVWAGASFGSGKLLSTVQQIVLARLLFPEDFGLLSIALLTIGTLDVFTQTGLDVALVQRPEADDRALDAGWTLALSRALILTVLLYALGPTVAAFFHAPRAAPLLQVLALTILIDGASNIGTVEFRRELRFGKQVLLGQSYILTNLIVSVGLALILQSVWAMIVARVVASTVRTVASYVICEYRPRLRPDWAALRELFHFGKYIFLTNVFAFLTMQGDDALVGRLLGTVALGFYTQAYALSNTPRSSITQIVSRVALPAYAKLQNDVPGLRTSYHKALRFTALLAFPMSAGLMVLAPDAVSVIYGDKWLPMAPAVQILCVFGAIRAVVVTAGPVFSGVGRPSVLTRLQLLQLVLTALFIYPLTRHSGVVGTSVAVTAAALVSGLFTARGVARTVQEPVHRLLVLLLPSLVATGIMAGVLYGARLFWPSQVLLPGLCILIALGAAIYAGAIAVLDRGLWAEIKGLFTLAFSNT